MTDIAMCKSGTCAARKDCKRHEACNLSFDTKNATMFFNHPESGYSCPNFIDTRKSTERMGFKMGDTR